MLAYVFLRVSPFVFRRNLFSSAVNVTPRSPPPLSLFFSLFFFFAPVTSSCELDRAHTAMTCPKLQTLARVAHSLVVLRTLANGIRAGWLSSIRLSIRAFVRTGDPIFSIPDSSPLSLSPSRSLSLCTYLLSHAHTYIRDSIRSLDSSSSSPRARASARDQCRGASTRDGERATTHRFRRDRRVGVHLPNFPYARKWTDNGLGRTRRPRIWFARYPNVRFALFICEKTFNSSYSLSTMRN